MGIQTILLFGCETIALSKKSINRMRITQGNMLKRFLGLRRSSHTTPLLHSLGIRSVDHIVNVQGLNLLRSCFTHHSSASVFYEHLFSKCSRSSTSGTLLERCRSFLSSHDISIVKGLTSNNFKTQLHTVLNGDVNQGLIDSIKFLYSSYDLNARNVLQGLVASYFC